MARPTATELFEARHRTVPDVVGPGSEILLCGINPGLHSAHAGRHFAGPGNRFWPALHRAGLTPRLLAPDEQNELVRWGLGITNLVSRPTARADELSHAELAAGARRLRGLLETVRPRCLAVLGITAYRVAFREPRAEIGPQPQRVGATPVWVLPNPSGLNAQWPLERIAAELVRLRAWCRQSEHGP